jgi:hypothetical protein
MTTIDYVRRLAQTIGPRGSTTPQEAEAARYAPDVLQEVGLEPATETFHTEAFVWELLSEIDGAKGAEQG